MTERDRIAVIVGELDKVAAAEEDAAAILQSGVEVVEYARLAANRAGLYTIAAALRRLAAIRYAVYPVFS